MRSTGPLLCLASATAFGAMGIFGKLAYGEGASVGDAARDPLRARGSAVLGDPGVHRGLRGLRALSRRDVGIALALGGIGYCVQTGAYFAALERIDASLLGLLVYTFPVIVTVAAIALGRETPSRRTAVSLLLASAGLVLVLAGAASGAWTPSERPSGLAAAVVYSVYILSSRGHRGAPRPARAQHAGVHRARRPPSRSAGLAGGGLAPVASRRRGGRGSCASPSSPPSARSRCSSPGLRRVGPSAASILSTVEPVVTVAAGVRRLRRVPRTGAARRRGARPLGRAGGAGTAPRARARAWLRDPWCEATRSRGASAPSAHANATPRPSHGPIGMPERPSNGASIRPVVDWIAIPASGVSCSIRSC